MSEPGRLWFGALGPLECRWDGTPLTLGGGKQQMVLALLLLEEGSAVSVDRLLEWVWGEEAEARNAATLQVYVSNLRRLLTPAATALGRNLLVTKRPGYQLELDEDESDLLQFANRRRIGEQARRDGDVASAVAAFRSALSLWRGAPLSGLPVDVEGAGAVARLEAARLSLLEQTADAELAIGRHREVVDELSAWLAANPLDERLRGHVMLALYRCGRQADALATYREGRALLVEELGIDPSRELRDLEAQILNQDPRLDHAPARRDPLADAASTQLRSSVLGPVARLDVDGQSIALDRAITTIGRLPDRDVVLDDAGVSRKHAEIRRAGTSFRIVDVGSANGVVVNDRRVSEHTLADGDSIRLGDVSITFHTID